MLAGCAVISLEIMVPMDEFVTGSEATRSSRVATGALDHHPPTKTKNEKMKKTQIRKEDLLPALIQVEKCPIWSLQARQARTRMKLKSLKSEVNKLPKHLLKLGTRWL